MKYEVFMYGIDLIPLSIPCLPEGSHLQKQSVLCVSAPTPRASLKVLFGANIVA